MECEIQIPKGYKLAQPLADKTLSGIARASYSVKYTANKEKCKINAEGTFPETIVDVPYYQQFIAFLEKFSEAVEKEVVFTKGK